MDGGSQVTDEFKAHGVECVFTRVRGQRPLLLVKSAVTKVSEMFREGYSVCINALVGRSDFRKGSISI